MAAALVGGLGLAAVPGIAVGAPSSDVAASSDSAALSAVAAPPGWRLVASDDFTGSAPGSVWGEYGGSYGIGANAWSPDEVSVSGGTLRVKMERKSSQGKPYTSGGVGMWGLAQQYGRYEFQAMAPTVAGIDSYITLWPPEGDGESNSTLVELLAKPAVSPGQQAAYVTINYGGGKSEKTVPGSYCGAFHDYVIEWTPTYESVSVDGTVLLKSPGSTSLKRWIGFVMSNGDTLTGTPSASAPLPAEFDIRHLRVYAYSPGAPGSTATSKAPATSHSSATATAATGSATAKGSTTSAKTATPASSTASTSAAGAVAGTLSSPAQSSSAGPPATSVPAANQSAVSDSKGIGVVPYLVAAVVAGAAAVGGMVFIRRGRGVRGSHRSGSR
ncbi:MAG: family 16 glycosylhydrolase [Catenulispora sp.]|nr:family 16 glycosylhydrolase [Catenulispora sp.]